MPVPHPRRLPLVLAAAAACAVALLLAHAVHAQQAGRTLTITYGKARVSMLDAAPRGLSHGRATLGDQVFVTSPIRTEGGVRGTVQLTFVVGSSRAAVARSAGIVTGVYHLADGDLFMASRSTFDDADVDHGAIVGGTGAYAGARGSVDSSATRDILHLLP